MHFYGRPCEPPPPPEEPWDAEGAGAECMEPLATLEPLEEREPSHPPQEPREPPTELRSPPPE